MFKDLDVVLKKARAIKQMLTSMQQSECGNAKLLEQEVSSVDFKHKKHTKTVQG